MDDWGYRFRKPPFVEWIYGDSMGINGDLTRKNGDRGYLDLLMMICYFPKGKSTTWGNFRENMFLFFWKFLKQSQMRMHNDGWLICVVC